MSAARVEKQAEATHQTRMTTVPQTKMQTTLPMTRTMQQTRWLSTSVCCAPGSSQWIMGSRSRVTAAVVLTLVRWSVDGPVRRGSASSTFAFGA